MKVAVYIYIYIYVRIYICKDQCINFEIRGKKPSASRKISRYGSDKSYYLYDDHAILHLLALNFNAVQPAALYSNFENEKSEGRGIIFQAVYTPTCMQYWKSLQYSFCYRVLFPNYLQSLGSSRNIESQAIGKSVRVLPIREFVSRSWLDVRSRSELA